MHIVTPATLSEHWFFFTCAIGIKRTKLRLVRCRARMSMNDRDRLNDARADQNLADVARIPAPWDVKPVEPTRTSTGRGRPS